MIPVLAIGTAWIIVGCAIAPRMGRAMKHADPGEDHEPDEPIEDRVVEARIRVQAELLVDEIAEYLAVQS